MRGVFSSVVEWAWQKFRFDADTSAHNALGWYSQFAGKYNIVANLEGLRALLPSKKGDEFDLYHTKSFMGFREVDGGSKVLPFITMRYEFDPTPGKVWIQLVLICEDRNDIPGNAYGTMGYRIEPPEESAPGGQVRSKHDYYHVQPLLEIKRGVGPLEQCPLWLPDHCPTWPLYVTGPVQAFLSVLVGLYGLRAIRELLHEANLDQEAHTAVSEFGKQISPESFQTKSSPTQKKSKRK